MDPLAARWMRAIPAIRETPLRTSLVASDLTAVSIEEFVRALEDVAVLAEQADPKAREVLSAAQPLLTDPARSELVEAFRAEAQASGHFAVSRLLRRRLGTRDGGHDVPAADHRHPGEARVGRAVTLGERKALARGHNRDVLDRLLRDPHPAVIRNILENPRITEDDIVRLAARRPTFPDIQSEIAKSPRWGIRPRVRLTIVQNPFTPTSVSVPLLPLLVRPELDQVLAAMDVPPVVRSAVIDLLERRPPIPLPEDAEIATRQ